MHAIIEPSFFKALSMSTTDFSEYDWLRFERENGAFKSNSKQKTYVSHTDIQQT